MHFKKSLQLLILLLMPAFLMAQVTTSSISGLVKISNGKPLESATITATHTPTGSTYKTFSNDKGQFNLANLRIGGPYVVTVSYVGLNTQKIEDIFLTLGTPYNLDFTMVDASSDLGNVTVKSVGKGAIISSLRNGTSTYISQRQIQSLPSINRSVQDFARLTPQVKFGNDAGNGNSTGLSIAGQSNRYNQFSIDGANASDGFGLGSTGTIGGQANVNPISMDAIQEIQVVLSPYDVTQGGFTGGGINAVTKSGTNKIHGSAYLQTQNESFIGDLPAYNSTTTKNKYGDFKNQTFGFTLGAPIIKNKLFFFGAVERFKKTTPLNYDPTVKGSGSFVNPDTLEWIKQKMLDLYGFDLGSYGAISNENKSTSVFGRIDWNINDKHKLTFRHNYVDGSNDIKSRTQYQAAFSNTGYLFKTKSNSSVLELNSNFSSSFSNMLRLTYTTIRDARATVQAPNLFIYNYDTLSKSTLSYNLGSDYSSAANSLNQDIFSITDNFNWYDGNHTFTIGTNNEFFKSSNVFLQGYYGAYTYGASRTTATNNLTNWANNTGLTQYQIGYSTSGRGDKASADLKAAQFSLYMQDLWAVKDNFKLTYGIRFDLPVVNSTPAENTAFNTAFESYGVATNAIPKKRVLYSPRIGFNWDVFKNAQTQVRGGFGLFTGRVPFVWISNQMSNTGIATKNLTYNKAADIASNNIKYTFDKSDPQFGAFIPSATSNTATLINVIDKNFKYPQILRSNLALDQKLPWWGLIGTVEAIFTKNINNANYTNLNLKSGGDTTMTIGPTTRPYWNNYVNSNYLQVIELQNTSKGYAMNFTVQIQKPFSEGWSGSIAYNWGRAKSLNDVPSSTALSSWRGSPSVNGANELDYSYSNYDMGGRISGFISKEFKYAKYFATTFTLFYNGQSGQRLSYVYASMSNNRNVTGEDFSPSSSAPTSLAYIPKTIQEANFADIGSGASAITATQQWQDFMTFANSNKYVKDHMGQNAQRNGDRLPWENHFDVRIAQDFIFKGTKLQVFYDVLNVGAMLKKTWGRSYYSNGSDGFYNTTATLLTPVIGAQKQDGVTINPTVYAPAFQFNINNFTKIDNDYRPYTLANFTSRWRSQIGIRFNF